MEHIHPKAAFPGPDLSCLTALRFLPRPRRIAHAAGAFPLRGEIGVVCAGADTLHRAQVERLAATVAPDAGFRFVPGPGSGSAPRVVLERNTDACLPAEGYRLTVEPAQVHILAAGDAGLRYGVGTLVQILRQVDAAIPCGEIEDHPDVPIRGVMLYLGGRIFHEDTMFDLIDRLAEWRVNQLQLEIEGVYAFERHPYANDHAKLSGPEIERLEAYGRGRGVDIVILQNSFGHMHNFLSIPRYRHLAECPDGFSRANGARHDPGTICPLDSGSLPFVAELYDELFTHSSSPWFHVGGDEPFELGLGRSAEAAAAIGKGRVYLEFLKQLVHEVERRGKQAMYWGDIVFEHADIVSGLPREALMVDWGYIAAYPFEEHAALLERHGVPYAFANASMPMALDTVWLSAANALRAGLPRKQQGMICTDWGFGEMYALNFLPYALTAAQAWCVESNTLEAALDGASRHVLGDDSGRLARAMYQVGSLWSRMGEGITTAGIIWNFCMSPREGMIHPGVTPEGIRLACDEVAALDAAFRDARFLSPCSEIMKAELDFVMRRLVFGCRRMRAVLDGREGDPALRAEFARIYRGFGEEYRELWHRRVKPGAWKEDRTTYRERAEEYERGDLRPPAGVLVSPLNLST